MIERAERVNRKLFYELAEHFERHPQSHRQSTWFDGYSTRATGNTDQLRRLRQLSDPEQLRQTVWNEPNLCGSAFCIAGAAVLASDELPEGYEMVTVQVNPSYPTLDVIWTTYQGSVRCPTGVWSDFTREVTTGAWSDCARELLGLTMAEAIQLFSAGWRPTPPDDLPTALRKWGDGIANGSPASGGGDLGDLLDAYGNPVLHTTQDEAPPPRLVRGLRAGLPRDWVWARSVPESPAD